MSPQSHQDSSISLLTIPAAHVRIRFVSSAEVQSELQVLGNRAGLLCLANVLLWFVANAFRKEFLSLGDLPFVQLERSLSVCIRLTTEGRQGNHGVLYRTDNGEQLEWVISEGDLQQVGLLMHHLISVPEHEYDRLEMGADTAAGIQVRMTDAAEWFERQ